MNFHEEYVLLNPYNRQNIIEIKFQFNAQNIRLFFTKSDQHQFLVLICETNEATVIKNMPFYDYNGFKHINGYWGTSYKYIKDYLLDENHKLTTFYQYVRKAIRIAIHDSHTSSHDLNKLKVILHPLDEGLKLLKSYKNKRVPIQKKAFIFTMFDMYI